MIPESRSCDEPPQFTVEQPASYLHQPLLASNLFVYFNCICSFNVSFNMFCTGIPIYSSSSIYNYLSVPSAFNNSYNLAFSNYCYHLLYSNNCYLQISLFPFCNFIVNIFEILDCTTTFYSNFFIVKGSVGVRSSWFHFVGPSFWWIWFWWSYHVYFFHSPELSIVL